MIAERIAEHISMAEAAQNWLLEIACPPVELLNSAERIAESHNGGTRSVWVASLEGCRIIWR